MDMKACRDGRYKRSKQCYCVLSMKIKAHNAFNAMFVNTVDTVALTQHLIQSTMRCENCIDSVDIDSIECIRDPCLVSTVSTYIVLMVWLRSPESQLSKTFLRIENPLNIKKVMGRNVWMCFVLTVST